MPAIATTEHGTTLRRRFISRRDTANDGARRARPRIWHTDWLLLRGMQSVIAKLAADLDRRGAAALDFGCGSRPYAELFTQAGMTYRGADFGMDAEIAIDASGRIAVTDSSTDLVLSFQVLEHVRDLDTYLAEARRVLKPDGLMILSTHGTWLYHPHPEDHRRWTRQGLAHDIESRGFTMIESIPVLGPLAWTTILRSTGASFVLHRIPVVGRALAGMLAALMNLRALAEDAVTPEAIRRDNACVYVTVSRPSLTP